MRVIDIFCGSIADCPTDIIVNASNTSLALGSVVSAAIREKCGGQEFQQECREVLEEQYGNELKQGDAVVTTGGISTYRWVIHAVTVDFNKGPYSSPEVVRNCMINSLKEAENIMEENSHDELSIGFPLFGSDTGRLGIEASCSAMCEGIRFHFRSFRESSINKILFVHPKEETIHKVKMTLNRSFFLK